ncbi:MAG: phosphotransferase enzyme family protein [Bacillota bacterium]
MPFPVTLSFLDPEALLHLVRERYGLPAETCRFVRPGFNHAYRIEAGEEPLYLRVYRARWREEGAIRWEVDLLLHLAERGVSVAAPLPALDGTYLTPLEAPEGTRFAVLFTAARGEPRPWSPEYARTYGRLMGELHRAAGDFSSPHPRFRLDLDHLIDQPLAHCHAFFPHRPEDLAELEAVAAEVRRGLAERASSLTHGICHGDLNGGNCHVSERLTLFDFDCAGPGWPAYDLATARAGMQQQRAGDGVWEALLDGYRSAHELREADWEAVPLFEAARTFWMIGLQLGNSHHLGTANMSDRFLDRQLQALRGWRKDPS